MKKIYSLICLFTIFSFYTCLASFAGENNFSEALETCKKYSKSENITRNGILYNLTISLESKGNNCIYKEKISEGNKSSALNCTFSKTILPALATSMKEYNNEFKAQIAKNKIYEAKMTNNYTIFKEYLANPQYCNITTSSTK